MKHLAALCFPALMAAAPATMTVTGPATARQGSSITITVTAVSDEAAAYQWKIGAQGVMMPAVGASGAAASKGISCTTDGTFCLMYGMNANVIGSGVLATHTVKIPANAPAGALAFPLSGVLGASATGDAVAVTLGTPYVVQVLPKQDLNSDGKVDATDVNLMSGQVIASQSNPAACVDDINGDGRCDLLDVISVLLKALGS